MTLSPAQKKVNKNWKSLGYTSLWHHWHSRVASTKDFVKLVCSKGKTKFKFYRDDHIIHNHTMSTAKPSRIPIHS